MATVKQIIAGDDVTAFADHVRAHGLTTMSVANHAMPVAEIAVLYGALKIVRFLAQVMPQHVTARALDLLMHRADDQRLHVLRFVLESSPGVEARPTEHALVSAAEAGHYDAVVYLVETCRIVPRTESYAAAVAGRSRAVIARMFEYWLHGPPGLFPVPGTTKDWDIVYSRGVVVWSSVARDTWSEAAEFAPAHALHDVVRAGDLSLLRSLRQDYGVVMPASVLVEAAAVGHVGIVEWFLTEAVNSDRLGMLPEAYVQAYVHNHAGVLASLRRRAGPPVLDLRDRMRVLCLAAQHGHLAVVKEVHGQAGPGDDVAETRRYRLMDLALRAPTLAVYRYLDRHGGVARYGPPTFAAVSWAMQRMHLVVLRRVLPRPGMQAEVDANARRFVEEYEVLLGTRARGPSINDLASASMSSTSSSSVRTVGSLKEFMRRDKARERLRAQCLRACEATYTRLQNVTDGALVL